MMLEFAVGINIAGKRESVTVAAEDGIAASSDGRQQCLRPSAGVDSRAGI